MLTAQSTLLLAEGFSPCRRPQRVVAQLALRAGGLGFRSAALHAAAAFWASWTDVVPVLRARDVQLANTLVPALDERRVVAKSRGQERLQASDALAETGFEVPRWAGSP